jgi:hypothetical protein
VVVLVAVLALWQPLHCRTSPGRSCSQALCCGKAFRRWALASVISSLKEMLAGTLTRTEPSASIGT